MATKKKAVQPKVGIDDISLEVWKTYKGSNFDMFIEAISSGCLTEHSGRIENYMKFNDTERLGSLIMNAVNTKIESWANDEIAKQYAEATKQNDAQ